VAVVEGYQFGERFREGAGVVEDVDLDLLGAESELVLGLFEGAGELTGEGPVLAALGGGKQAEVVELAGENVLRALTLGGVAVGPIGAVPIDGLVEELGDRFAFVLGI